MKFSFFFLFLSIFVFSQSKIGNITSATLHKVYNQPCDSGCNPFFDRQNGDVISKTIIDKELMVSELIALKSSLKNRKSTISCCQPRIQGCGTIEYMVTYQFNKLIDTLYYNIYKNEKTIIDYNKHKEYNDSKSELYKILSKSKVFLDLINLNANKLFRETFEYNKLDSINVNSIKVNDKVIYGLNRNEIEKLINGFDRIETESEKYKDWKINYKCYKDTICSKLNFYNDKLVSEFVFNKPYNIDYKDSIPLDVLGLKPGDEEQKLFQKFPNYKVAYENQLKYFINDKNEYSIDILFYDKKGILTFVLSNGIIERIETKFRYN